MVLLVPADTPPEGPVTWKDRWDGFCCWCNKEPQLSVRRGVWIVTVGWALAVFYGFAAFAMAMSLVFIPFVLPALQLAWFVLDPIGKEAVAHDRYNRAFCIAANVTWLFFFGWELTLLLLAAAVVSLLTIIGIPTALAFVEFAEFTLWPFGKDIRRRHLPTTVAELRAGKSGGGGGSGKAPNVQLGGGAPVFNEKGSTVV